MRLGYILETWLTSIYILFEHHIFDLVTVIPRKLDIRIFPLGKSLHSKLWKTVLIDHILCTGVLLLYWNMFKISFPVNISYTAIVQDYFQLGNYLGNFENHGQVSMFSVCCFGSTTK